jgi:integrase
MRGYPTCAGTTSGIRALPYCRLVAHPKLVQHLLSHASIQLTFDRYSHWMPSMGRSTADGMDEALD